MPVPTTTQPQTITTGPPVTCEPSEKRRGQRTAFLVLTKPKKNSEETPAITLMTEKETPKLCRVLPQRLYKHGLFVTASPETRLDHAWQRKGVKFFGGHESNGTHLSSCLYPILAKSASSPVRLLPTAASIIPLSLVTDIESDMVLVMVWRRAQFGAKIAFSSRRVIGKSLIAFPLGQGIYQN